MQTAQIFDTYAADYKQKFIRNPLADYQRSQVYELIRPFLKAGMRILDVGCGPGSDFQFYQTLDLNVHAIDISEKMVELARIRSEELHFKVEINHSSLMEYKSTLPYEVILLNFGVINVFDNLTDILDKLSSLLQADGILILVSMPPFHLFFFLECLIKLKFVVIAERLFRKVAMLKSGFIIYYRGKRDFSLRYRLIKRHNLGPFLPSPDQYSGSKWARITGKLLMKFDSWIAPIIPDWFGGDHVCYILTPDNNGEKDV